MPPLKFGYFGLVDLPMRVLARLITALLFIAVPVLALADDRGDLFLAASRNNAHWVSESLQHGLDPNLREPQRGDTALILALRENAMGVFDVLLNSAKTDLEAASNNGDTALMIASYTGNRAAVQALLDKDVEVNRHGWTALHYAAAIGDCDIIKLLLEKSAYIDAEAPNKTTPIMMAARAGKTDAVKLLTEQGADISLKNDQGLSAADFAVNNDHNQVAQWLNASLKAKRDAGQKD